MGAIAEGTGLSREALTRRWAQIVADPVLSDLPYTIELDEWGDIRMTPAASPKHMEIGFSLALALRTALGGKAFQDGAIVTQQGVLTADVVWCSPEYVARHDDVFAEGVSAMPEAPEICIEVVSASNAIGKLEQKMVAYLSAGAVESWIVREDLSVRIFRQDGERKESQFPMDLAAWRRSLS
jgi:Uma2 family endonuclease